MTTEALPAHTLESDLNYPQNTMLPSRLPSEYYW